MLINHGLRQLLCHLSLVAPCCQPPITDITIFHKRLIIGLARGVTHVGLYFRLSETVSDQAQQLSVHRDNDGGGGITWPSLSEQAGDGRQRAAAAASENSALERLVSGPGRA